MTIAERGVRPGFVGVLFVRPRPACLVPARSSFAFVRSFASFRSFVVHARTRSSSLASVVLSFCSLHELFRAIPARVECRRVSGGRAERGSRGLRCGGRVTDGGRCEGWWVLSVSGELGAVPGSAACAVARCASRSARRICPRRLFLNRYQLDSPKSATQVI